MTQMCSKNRRSYF